MRWFRKPKPEPEKPILFLALKELITAARILIDNRPNDPALEGLRHALRFYKGYWDGSEGHTNTGSDRR